MRDWVPGFGPENVSEVLSSGEGCGPEVLSGRGDVRPKGLTQERGLVPRSGLGRFGPETLNPGEFRSEEKYPKSRGYPRTLQELSPDKSPNWTGWGRGANSDTPVV